ncbi:hypothetical protein KQH29_00240 [bacterium]|nr:hypothetical protein [bacterium]
MALAFYSYRTLNKSSAHHLRLSVYTIMGSTGGFLLIHPFSMFVFSITGMTHYSTHFGALLHSFEREMWPMWVWYAALGGIWGFGMGLLVNRIRMFDGLVKVCAWCGRIEDRKDAHDRQPVWKRLDYFLMERGVQESHGICPDCLDQYKVKKAQKAKQS